MNDVTSLSRRRFLDALPGIAVCGGALQVLTPQAGQQQSPSLPSPFTPGEEKAVGRSLMAREIENLAGRGFS
jgi:hypothetical protein